MLIWDKVNDWKFWALANGHESFYQLLLESPIRSTKDLIYVGSEPFLSPVVPRHQRLKREAKRLLDPIAFREFVAELFGDERETAFEQIKKPSVIRDGIKERTESDKR